MTFHARSRTEFKNPAQLRFAKPRRRPQFFDSEGVSKTSVIVLDELFHDE
jgi:hypothetical protein